MGFTSWNYDNTSSVNRQQQANRGFANWSNTDAAPAETSYDSGWNSNQNTITDSFANEDWSTGSWRHEFPDNSGTKNPQNDPERIRRIEYLENQLYTLRDAVKNGDWKVDTARERVSDLQYQLRDTREQAREARAGHLASGKKKAGLEGDQIGNKEHIARLQYELQQRPGDSRTREILSELDRRGEMRYRIADDIADVSDRYREVTYKMHELERKVETLDRELTNATEEVERKREERRMKKEQLDEYQRELDGLKSNSFW